MTRSATSSFSVVCTLDSQSIEHYSDEYYRRNVTWHNRLRLPLGIEFVMRKALLSYTHQLDHLDLVTISHNNTSFILAFKLPRDIVRANRTLATCRPTIEVNNKYARVIRVERRNEVVSTSLPSAPSKTQVEEVDTLLDEIFNSGL
jgi:hypothetical protein